MDLSIQPNSNDICERILFKLKPLRPDGLLVNIHPKLNGSSRNVRFITASFHSNRKLVSVADNNGDIVIIDYDSQKFWKLQPQFCGFLKFSVFNTDELLIALFGGEIKVVNFESGCHIETMKGHKTSVKNMSFAEKSLLLSASEEDAILWDMKTYTMLQVLDLERKMYLKTTCFIPTTSKILACFQDDFIQVWDSINFENIKILSPKNWKNYFVKSITFTRNSQIMVIAGYSPILTLFLLESWKFYKSVNLCDFIKSVRHIEFIPQSFDGGFNKILAILSQQGVIYFYNFEKNVMMNELRAESEIKHFEISADGSYIACLLHCGYTGLYNIQQYSKESIMKQTETSYNKRRKLMQNQMHIGYVREIKCEMNTILNREKLKAILDEYEEFPGTHRVRIWEQLLQLPSNYKIYNTLINNRTIQGFDNLEKKYPLDSRISIRALRKLLSNLVTWCPLFANIDFLPVFTFPFVKVFQNKPIACFEATCTIILNWCQYWFEYFPLTPFNILAIIENMLYEHDPELLNFFVNLNISSCVYAWQLLTSAFSEVLSSSEWLKLWDHVFTNEVSFLLCTAAAYSIVQRDTLLKLSREEEFKCFYENQNPIDVKKLLKTAYILLHNTSEANHPRQYIKNFESIREGSYTVFKGYPKFLFDIQQEDTNGLEEDFAQSIKFEHEILRKRSKEQDQKLVANLKAQEHERRMKEMEKVLRDRIKSRENLLKEVSNKLLSLKSFEDLSRGDASR